MLRFQQAEKRSQYEEECRKMAIREEVQRKQLDQLSEEIEQKRKLIEWERDTVSDYWLFACDLMSEYHLFIIVSMA